MPIHTSAAVWELETATTAYAFGVNSAGALVNRFWGPRLPARDDYPAAETPPNWASFNNPPHLMREEFPAVHDLKFIDPCLKVTFADGVRDTALQVVDWSPGLQDGVPLVRIHLRDAHYPLAVTLVYRVWEAYDLIERWAEVRNEGDAPITLERIFSAQWHLPPGDRYRLTHLTGRWFDEFHLRREPLTHGLKTLESRRLHTSHHHNPWFAIDRGAADEAQGEVWFGLLAWSGNWKLTAEVTDFQSTRVNIGLNDWDFAWRLGPGETFTAPAAVAGYTPNGFGGASAVLQRFIREQALPHGAAPRRILYNSWEATTFHVSEANQMRFAEIAADLGVELFVMDDGWFLGRDDDTAGLGDWTPDPDKFPEGLGRLIQYVQHLGMDFGLWVEPEMVNRDSELYRAHPDWVLHYPDRPRTEGRNQLILNLARTDVQDYLIESLHRLLRENDIAFIKWDMNRAVSEAGWPDYPGEQKEIWVRYVQGLYRVWGELRRLHPDVIWQSCSGGGGRIDLGILRLADQAWVSDNTGGAARLAIQEGISQFLPACAMEAWVTDMEPHLPLSFRFHVSMCGALGVGANITHWTPEQRAEAQRCIRAYKSIRRIVQEGTQHRLVSPQAGEGYAAVQYVDEEGLNGVLFAFRTHIPDPAPPLLVRLRGLIPERRYTVEGQGAARSGAAWMALDIAIPLANFESALLRVTAV